MFNCGSYSFYGCTSLVSVPKFKITNVDVKVRYASIKKKGDVYISEDLQSSIIHLRESEIGIAKGQSAVIYVGDQVVLGGIINKIFY